VLAVIVAVVEPLFTPLKRSFEPLFSTVATDVSAIVTVKERFSPLK
jgi:hypothetical protein